MNEYIIINKTSLLKKIEELEEEIKFLNARDAYCDISKLSDYKQILSQSTPLIPDIKDIQIWLSKQSYQKEYGEQEYMMYYDVDVPKIIQDYISNLKLDI